MGGTKERRLNIQEGYVYVYRQGSPMFWRGFGVVAVRPATVPVTAVSSTSCLKKVPALVISPCSFTNCR